MATSYDKKDDSLDIEVSDDERAKRRAVLDKTTGKALERNWQQGDRSELELKEQKLAPPVIIEPRCHVCTSEYRVHIELLLVKGIGYQTIERQIPEDKDGNRPGRKSIKKHYFEHMPIERQQIRTILEEEADILRQNYDEGVTSALTDRGMLRVMAQKAYEDVIKNVTTVEPKDAIQIIKLLNEMSTNVAQIKNEETEAAIRLMIRAIQNVCSPDIQGAISTEFKRLQQMDEVEFAIDTNLDQKVPVEPAIQLEAENIQEVEVVDEGTRPPSDN